MKERFAAAHVLHPANTVILGRTPQTSQAIERLAPQVGLEPTTLRLTAGCSAIELLRSVGGHAFLNVRHS